MPKSLLWYAVPEHDEETRYSVESGWSLETERDYAAEEAAEDYWHNHDGWDSRWPLTIVLFESEDGPEIGRYLVEQDSEPVFSARPVRPGG